MIHLTIKTPDQVLVDAPLAFEHFSTETRITAPATATLSLGTDVVILDAAAWRALGDTRDFRGFVGDAKGTDLECAVRAQVDQVESTYRHCGTEWTDTWSCSCDSECPTCGKDIQPVTSRQVEGLVEIDHDDGPAFTFQRGEHDGD